MVWNHHLVLYYYITAINPQYLEPGDVLYFGSNFQGLDSNQNKGPHLGFYGKYDRIVILKINHFGSIVATLQICHETMRLWFFGTSPKCFFCIISRSPTSPCWGHVGSLGRWFKRPRWFMFRVPQESSKLVPHRHPWDDISYLPTLTP